MPSESESVSSVPASTAYAAPAADAAATTTDPVVLPTSQARYQVRLLVGADAAAVLAATRAAEVVIVADVLDDGDLDQLGRASAERGPAEIVVAGLRTRTAAAHAVLDAQVRLGERAHVWIVTPGRLDGGFAVEDFLAAGAVVDALAAVGLDYSSPEAAAACAAFTSLHRAVGHLVSASAAGQAWVAAGRAAEVADACRIDASDVVLSVSADAGVALD